MKGNPKSRGQRIAAALRTKAQVKNLKRENGDLHAALKKVKARAAALQAKVDEIEKENQRIAERHVAIECQTSRLYGLLTASCRLSESHRREDVLRAIEEIVVGVIGCEEFALYELDPDRAALQLASAMGVAAEQTAPSNGWVGRTVAGGQTFLADTPASTPGSITACVPLRVGGAATGGLVLYRLLPHKRRLEPLDREVLELIGTQAATALYFSRLYERAGAKERAWA